MLQSNSEVVPSTTSPLRFLQRSTMYPIRAFIRRYPFLARCPLERPFLIRLDSRRTKKRNFGRVTGLLYSKPDVFEGSHERCAGGVLAVGEAQERQHEEQMPAWSQVGTVAPQHLAASLCCWHAVDDHAEDWNCTGKKLVSVGIQASAVPLDDADSQLQHRNE